MAGRRQAAELASDRPNPRHGDQATSEGRPPFRADLRALAQIVAETGLSGWGGRTLNIVYRFENVSLKCRENVRGSAA
jgi:hypothetical protein